MGVPNQSTSHQNTNTGIDLKHLKTISALAEQGSLAGAALCLNPDRAQPFACLGDRRPAAIDQRGVEVGDQHPLVLPI